MSLKDSWSKTGHAFGEIGDAGSIKEAGKGTGRAFKSLGKSIIKSVEQGVRKADEWANSEDYEQPQDNSSNNNQESSNTLTTNNPNSSSEE